MTLPTFLPPEIVRKAFAAFPVGLGVCTLNDGRFLEANEFFLRLTGLAREELLGHTDAELGIWPDVAARERWRGEVAAKGVARDFECRLRSKAGDLRDTLVSAELVELGGAPCVLFAAYDMTERLHQEVQLRQAQKMEAVGQLATGFAHGFNNILAIVQGYTSLVLSSPGLDPQTVRALTEVTKAAERAANLTRQLLTLSRKQRMQPKVVDLNQVVKGMASMLQHLLGDKVEFKLNFLPDTLPLKADPGMLEQLLVNLAANARDAMPQGGLFAVTTAAVEIDEPYARVKPGARVGSFACLMVSDSGCGMSPETLNRLFEPFFTTKAVGQGVGLGLSTVYGIVKQHRGWTEVTSHPGQGTTFKVFLPADEAVAAARKAVAASAPAAAALPARDRILVVEDEPALRMMVEDVLRRSGYEVLTANDGVDAQQVWQREQGRFDLLLTDMAMPEGITGRQLAALLRRDKPGLKVIYSSGYSVDMLGDEGEPLVEGRNFLQKPYRLNSLAETVRQCLRSTADPSGGTSAAA
jgi:PAS domain S-box-containing protein